MTKNKDTKSANQNGSMRMVRRDKHDVARFRAEHRRRLRELASQMRVAEESRDVRLKNSLKRQVDEEYERYHDLARRRLVAYCDRSAASRTSTAIPDWVSEVLKMRVRDTVAEKAHVAA